jgi:hypothetical protein
MPDHSDRYRPYLADLTSLGTLDRSRRPTLSFGPPRRRASPCSIVASAAQGIANKRKTHNNLYEQQKGKRACVAHYYYYDDDD